MAPNLPAEGKVEARGADPTRGGADGVGRRPNQPQEPRYIVTEPGVGYRFVTDE